MLASARTAATRIAAACTCLAFPCHRRVATHLRLALQAPKALGGLVLRLWRAAAGLRDAPQRHALVPRAGHDVAVADPGAAKHPVQVALRRGQPGQGTGRQCCKVVASPPQQAKWRWHCEQPQGEARRRELSGRVPAAQQSSPPESAQAGSPAGAARRSRRAAPPLLPPCRRRG